MTHFQSVISFGPHIQLCISKDIKRNIVGFHTIIQSQVSTPSMTFEEEIGQYIFPDLETEYHTGNRPELRRQWVKKCLSKTAEWIQQRAFDLAFDDLNQDRLKSALTAFQDIADYAMPFNKNTTVKLMLVLLSETDCTSDETEITERLSDTLNNLVSNTVPSQYLNRILDATSRICTREHLLSELQQWIHTNSPQSSTYQTIRRWLFQQEYPNTLPTWKQHAPLPFWGAIQHNPNDDIGIISSNSLAIRDNTTEEWTEYPISLNSSSPQLFGLWNGNWWIFEQTSITEWNPNATTPSKKTVDPFLIIEEIIHINSFQGRPYAIGLNANNELYLELWDRRNQSWLSIHGTDDNVAQVYTVQPWKNGCQICLSTLVEDQWQWLQFDFFDQTVHERTIQDMTGHPLIINEQLYWIQEREPNTIVCIGNEGEELWCLSNRQTLHSIRSYNDQQFLLIESDTDTLSFSIVNINDGSTASESVTTPYGQLKTLTLLNGHLWIHTPTQTYSIFC